MWWWLVGVKHPLHELDASARRLVGIAVRRSKELEERVIVEYELEQWIMTWGGRSVAELTVGGGDQTENGLGDAMWHGSPL